MRLNERIGCAARNRVVSTVMTDGPKPRTLKTKSVPSSATTARQSRDEYPQLILIPDQPVARNLAPIQQLTLDSAIEAD